MRSEIESLPIYKKAIEIMELVSSFEPLITNSKDEFIFGQLPFLIENAIMIPAKIAGAKVGDLYNIRMESTTIIGKAARKIYVSMGSFEFAGL